MRPTKTQRACLIVISLLMAVVSVQAGKNNPGFIDETLLRAYGCYAGLGAVALTSGLAYLNQAKHLTNSSFKDPEESAMIFPVINNHYSGIILARRI